VTIKPILEYDAWRHALGGPLLLDGFPAMFPENRGQSTLSLQCFPKTVL
jgi:hypothetical protein